MKRLWVLWVVGAVCYSAAGALGVPQQINFQGQLTGNSGIALDTTVAMTFTLYSDSTGGTLLWTETRPAVAVAQGLFVVPLGQISTIPDSVWNRPQVWLGISVGGDSEMAPRNRIISTAYAYRVGTVDGAIGGTIGSDVVIQGKLNSGGSNTDEGTFTAVHGQNNHARGNYSVIAGGGGASVLDSNSTIGTATTVSGGRQNSVVGDYSTISGGLLNHTGDHYATISGGLFNQATLPYCTISGGQNNAASGSTTVIGGGQFNTASGTLATIGGGSVNAATANYSTVGGGTGNFARGTSSVIAGGGGAGLDSNSVLGTGGTIGGGRRHSAQSDFSTISGGYQNTAGNTYTAVSGGAYNSAWGFSSTVSGGQTNTALGYTSTISGGVSNWATNTGATVGGGQSNTASGYLSTVGGGSYGVATDTSATIAGGDSNFASGAYSFVGSGRNNAARGLFSVVSGGGGYVPADSNSANGSHAAVGGGQGNSATGVNSVIPGGNSNSATGANSFAAGQHAVAGTGSFVWGSSSTGHTTISVGNYSVVFRCQGGAAFYTDSSHTNIGVGVAPGSGTWLSLSDSTTKRNRRNVDTEAILQKVVDTPIQQWSYKSQAPSIEHIGPMAQDFWKEFHVGDDSLTISTIDPSGIALAAIQELARRNAALEDHNSRLEEELQRLKLKVEALEAHSASSDNYTSIDKNRP